MRIFGIDPGSERTGYGCLDTDGSRHRLVVCGALSTPAATSFPDRLLAIHAGLRRFSLRIVLTASPSRTSFTRGTCAAR